MRNVTRGGELADRVRVASGWWSRFRGLLGTSGLAPGEGLLLTPCRCVHTWGMRYAIDVVFLDGEGRSLAIYRELPPGRSTGWHREAVQVLELPAGAVDRAGARVDDRLEIAPASLTDHLASGNRRATVA